MKVFFYNFLRQNCCLVNKRTFCFFSRQIHHEFAHSQERPEGDVVGVERPRHADHHRTRKRRHRSVGRKVNNLTFFY